MGGILPTVYNIARRASARRAAFCPPQALTNAEE